MPSPNNSFRQGKASRTRTRLPRKLREPVEVPLLLDDVDGDGEAFEEDCALGSGDWDWEWDEDAGKGLGVSAGSESGIGIGIGLGAGIVGSGLIGSGIGIVGGKIGERIPGYRVSAAFLSTLRQNLALTTSLLPPDSPATTATTMSSPPSLHSSTTLPSSTPQQPALTPRSPTSTPSNSITDTPPLPELTYALATTADKKYPALKLVADALAQRRQTSSSVIVFSGPFLAAAVAVFGALFQYMYVPSQGYGTLPLICTTFAGVAMALLVAVRWLGGGYLALAEKINWEWLGDAEVVVVEWGTPGDMKVVGACVFEEEEADAKSVKGGKGKKKAKKGVVKAWTVRLRERGRGVGRGLLEEVAQIGHGRGWEGVRMIEGGIFDEKVLPGIYHRYFERRMDRARVLVGEVWEEERENEGKRKG
ncbi:hypothetical protein MMC30_002707 [Trapelia coarctata]|nr:hypothetical protein [Trapelia coarctata]